MKRYLLDSNAVSAFIARRDPFFTRAREARLLGHRLGTCEPVVTELLYGLEFSASRDLNLVLLNRAYQNCESGPSIGMPLSKLPGSWPI